MQQEIPNGAAVRIIKPSDDYYDWPMDQQRVSWIPRMDDYIGGIYIVEEYDHPNNSYNLREIGNFTWHRDWLVVLSKSKDGSFEPYDNQGRAMCFWCKGLLKTTKEKCGSGLLVFNYCPRCKR
jgi:hypothetical protein